jgi:hypothetical protein
MGKVFGIGLNKTATKSLSAACEQLGLRTLHDSRLVSRTFMANRERGARLLESLEGYDAYFDLGFWTGAIEYPEMLRQLDRGYPGSRFVLHTRSVDSWVGSRREQRSRKNTRSVARRLLKRVRPRPIGPDWEADARQRFEECHRVALEYFRDRPQDLLLFDATEGHGWRELCAFLERPIPTDDSGEPLPFPHRGKGSERPLYRRKRYPLLKALRWLEERVTGH